MLSEKHFPMPEQAKKESAASKAEQPLEHRLIKSFDSSDEAIQEAEEALRDARPEQAGQAQRVRELQGKTTDLRGRLARGARAAGLLAGLAVAAIGIHSKKDHFEDLTRSAHAQELPKQDAPDAAPEPIRPEIMGGKYHAQDALARQFLDTVANKLGQTGDQALNAEQNDEVEKLASDLDKSLNETAEGESHTVFLKLAQNYRSLSPEQQKKIRQTYAHWRHTWKWRVGEFTRSQEKDLEEEDEKTLAEDKRQANAAQQVMDEMEAAIGPKDLKAALKDEQVDVAKLTAEAAARAQVEITEMQQALQTATSELQTAERTFQQADTAHRNAKNAMDEAIKAETSLGEDADPTERADASDRRYQAQKAFIDGSGVYEAEKAHRFAQEKVEQTSAGLTEANSNANSLNKEAQEKHDTMDREPEL